MNTKKLLKILKSEGLDAYVIYDFRGSNFIGRSILGFTSITTRKFVSVLAKDGNFHIISKMEALNYSKLQGKKVPYTTYREFETSLKNILGNYKKIAVDTSNENLLPIVDLAPLGFIELIRKLNPRAKLVSSENLTQSLASTWGAKGYKTHKTTVMYLTEIFGKTFEYIGKGVKKEKGVTDFEVMKYAISLQEKAGLHTDGENICIIASGVDSKNPHYCPQKVSPHKIQKNAPLLADMWARTKDRESIYADFTLYCWVGPEKPPGKLVETWNSWKEARDLSVEFIRTNIKKGVRGFEVDRKIRKYFENKGYLKYLLHRSGHSLGQKEHGNGANLDDFETHDTRLLLSDQGFTIEPGIYMKNFGVRGEINLYIHPNYKAEVTTPLQNEIITL